MSAAGQSDNVTAENNSSSAETEPGSVLPTPDAGADAPPPSADAAPAGAGEGSVDPTPAPEGGKAPAAPTQDWKDKRIATLTARLRESQAKPANTDVSQVELQETEIQRRAEVLAATNDFNRRCQDVAESGRGSFTDFDSKIAQLQQLVTPGDATENAAYVRMIEATLETDDAPRLLYELGNNPDDAMRLMRLSPVKLGMELAKLANKKGEPEPSKVPKPVNPVGARGRANEEIDPADAARADNLSTRSWIERRQRDIDNRRKSGERIW